MTLRKKLIIPAFLLLAGAAYVGGNALIDSRIENAATAMLEKSGFQEVSYEELSYENGSILVKNIKLDEKGFSRINTLSVPFSLFGQNKEAAFAISDAVITAQLMPDYGLNVAGWTSSPVNSAQWHNMRVENTIVDIGTEYGAFRFVADGKTQSTDDAIIISGTLNADQKPLSLNSKWDGRISENGAIAYEIDIRDARFHFENMNASRISGWIAVEKSQQDPIPVLSSQLAFGMISIGAVSTLNSFVTLSGPLHRQHIIAKGEIAGFSDMLFDYESRYENNINQIDAKVRTQNLDDLMAFMMRLHETGQKTEFFGTLSSLLLTEGNLSRVRQDIERHGYDELEFTIYGERGALSGTVIAYLREGGVKRKYVTSLEPAL